MTAKAGIRKATRAKRQFDALIEFLAWTVGWLGVAMLAGCLLLWAIPEQHWGGVAVINPKNLPVYTLIALMCASLVGWRYINLGEERLTKTFGNAASLVAFVILPVACLLAEIATEPVARHTGASPPGHPLWLFVHWYPICVIALSALAFLAWKSKPRRRVYFDRGLGYALLLTPYVLLFAFFQVGLHMDWLDAPMRETFGSLGQWAIVVQLVMAYFVGAE